MFLVYLFQWDLRNVYLQTPRKLQNTTYLPTNVMTYLLTYLLTSDLPKQFSNVRFWKNSVRILSQSEDWSVIYILISTYLGDSLQLVIIFKFVI